MLDHGMTVVIAILAVVVAVAILIDVVRMYRRGKGN